MASQQLQIYPLNSEYSGYVDITPINGNKIVATLLFYNLQQASSDLSTGHALDVLHRINKKPKTVKQIKRVNFYQINRPLHTFIKTLNMC